MGITHCFALAGRAECFARSNASCLRFRYGCPTRLAPMAESLWEGRMICGRPLQPLGDDAFPAPAPGRRGRVDQAVRATHHVRSLTISSRTEGLCARRQSWVKVSRPCRKSCVEPERSMAIWRPQLRPAPRRPIYSFVCDHGKGPQRSTQARDARIGGALHPRCSPTRCTSMVHAHKGKSKSKNARCDSKR